MQESIDEDKMHERDMQRLLDYVHDEFESGNLAPYVDLILPGDRMGRKRFAKIAKIPEDQALDMPPRERAD
ncbi:MAG: hypothetical protein ACYTG0_06510 [Planctomycetota bacterium]